MFSADSAKQTVLCVVKQMCWLVSLCTGVVYLSVKRLQQLAALDVVLKCAGWYRYVQVLCTCP